MEHTATPWILRKKPYPTENDKHWIDDKKGIPIANVFDYDEANAEFIVRAVNSFDGLVEACKGAIAALSQNKTFPEDINAAKAFLNNALKQAEEN